MPKPSFTSEEAREAGIRSGEARRRKREEAERLAEEAWRGMLQASLDKHLALLGAESEQVALAAVKENYDRLLGRSVDRHELSGAGGGPVEVVVRSAFEAAESGEGSRPDEGERDIPDGVS